MFLFILFLVRAINVTYYFTYMNYNIICILIFSSSSTIFSLPRPISSSVHAFSSNSGPTSSVHWKKLQCPSVCNEKQYINTQTNHTQIKNFTYILPSFDISKTFSHYSSRHLLSKVTIFAHNHKAYLPYVRMQKMLMKM